MVGIVVKKGLYQTCCLRTH